MTQRNIAVANRETVITRDGLHSWMNALVNYATKANARIVAE
jgi:hypothetical protein